MHAPLPTEEESNQATYTYYVQLESHLPLSKCHHVQLRKWAGVRPRKRNRRLPRNPTCLYPLSSVLHLPILFDSYPMDGFSIPVDAKPGNS